MPSSDIATAVEDGADSAVVTPVADGPPPPPPPEQARQNDRESTNKEGARVVFRDEEEFRRKRERMVADGAHQLQVIAGRSVAGMVPAGTSYHKRRRTREWSVKLTNACDAYRYYDTCCCCTNTW